MSPTPAAARAALGLSTVTCCNFPYFAFWGPTGFDSSDLRVAQPLVPEVTSVAVPLQPGESSVLVTAVWQLQVKVLALESEVQVVRTPQG